MYAKSKTIYISIYLHIQDFLKWHYLLGLQALCGLLPRLTVKFSFLVCPNFFSSWNDHLTCRYIHTTYNHCCPCLLKGEKLNLFCYIPILYLFFAEKSLRWQLSSNFLISSLFVFLSRWPVWQWHHKGSGWWWYWTFT